MLFQFYETKHFLKGFFRLNSLYVGPVTLLHYGRPMQ